MSYKIIALTQGRETKVSPEDFDFLSQWKWCYLNIRGNEYAYRTEAGRKLYMHRELCETELFVDHKNGNGLDNTRDNLRPATRSQNSMNTRQPKHGKSSPSKGVYLMDVSTDRYARYAERPYKAHVSIDGKRVHIGYFATLEDAMKARDARAAELHGEFYRK
jgi:HNH endonuclease